MQIVAHCPRCGYSMIFDGIDADKRKRCGKCRRLFKVPDLEEMPKAVDVIEKAKGPLYVDPDGKTYG